MYNCTEIFKSGIRDSAFAVPFKFWISIRLFFIRLLLSISLKIEMFYTTTYITWNFGPQMCHLPTLLGIQWEWNLNEYDLGVLQKRKECLSSRVSSALNGCCGLFCLLCLDNFLWDFKTRHKYKTKALWKTCCSQNSVWI